MTLKEKFDKISCKDCDMPYCDIKCTILTERDLNKLEQIADEYAIEFALFLSLNCEINGDKDGWWFYNNQWKTTNELLEIFKNQQGL